MDILIEIISKLSLIFGFFVLYAGFSNVLQMVFEVYESGKINLAKLILIYAVMMILIITFSVNVVVKLI
jgi:hypothetical protein